MIRPLRKSLNLLIAFTMAAPSFAGAAPVTETPSAIAHHQQIADAYSNRFDDLEKSGAGQVKGSLAPDRFLLMEQTVFHKEIPVVRTFVGHIYRRNRLQALLKKTAAYAVALPDDQEELTAADLPAFAKDLLPAYARMKWIAKDAPIEKAKLAAVSNISNPGTLADAILPLLSLEKSRLEEAQAITDPDERLDFTVTAMLTNLTRDHVTNGRRVDTPLYIWEAQKSAARLNRIASVLEETQARWQSYDNMNISNPTESPLERKTRAINWWDTSIKIQSDDKVLKTLNMRDTAAGTDTAQGQPFFCAESKCRFNIMKDGTFLHSFGIPSKVVATFNQFVVFTHADGYDAETGIQYLFFLDLKSYNGLIGNEDIPVFRLPLKIDEPINSLTIRDGNLLLNNNFVLKNGYIEQASEMQKVAFNLQANLLSADSWAKVLPLVDNVQQFFSKKIASELAAPVEELQGTKEAMVLMTRLGTELQNHLDAQKKLKPLSAQESKDLKAIVETAPVEQAIDSVRLYHKRVSESEQLATIMAQTQDRSRVSRKLTARVRLLAAALVSPRPFASQKIKEALGSWYVRRDGNNGGVMERLLRLTDRPFTNAGVIAAGLMAAVAPESFNDMISLGLHVGNSIVDYVTFALGGIGEATVEGTGRTYAPVTELSTIPQQYFWDDAKWRTLIAIPSFIGVLGGLYYVGHFAFNFAALRRDLKKPGITGFADRQEKFKEEYFRRLGDDEAKHRDMSGGAEFSPEEDARIRQWAESRRVEFSKTGMLHRLGGSIRRSVGGAIATAVQDVRDAVGSVSTNFRLWFRPGSTTVSSDLVDAAVENLNGDLSQAIAAAESSTAVNKAETDTKEDNVTFWKAFQNTAMGDALGNAADKMKSTIQKNGRAAKEFTFSTPALELTIGGWTRVWNEWAQIRTATFGWAKVRILGSDIPYMVKVKPISFVAKLLYPEFQRTVGLRRTGERVLPTDLNGGLRNRVAGWWKETAQGAASGISDLQLGISSVQAEEALSLPSTWDPRLQLQALEKFEDQIIDVEKEISEVAFRRSLEELSKYITDKKDLETLFNAKGLDNIAQPEIRELTWKAQTFVRAHYDSAYDAAMKKYLSAEVERREGLGSPEPAVSLEQTPAVIPDEAAGAVDVTQEDAQDSLLTLKNRMANMNLPVNGVVADYGFDLSAAKAAALSVAGDASHVDAAKAAVAQGRMSPANFIRNTKYGLISDYDPTQNRTMERVEIVDRRLKQPAALGRAVRAEIAKLKLTVPIELTARLIFTAGIFEGALKPLQDHFWGPNSIFYLSETSFYMIFASGFFMSMMADAWLKLQQDARQDEAGEFGAIPVGEDAEKSFLRWYMKQFNEKENSLVKNWLQANMIAFWNLPAALPNILLFWGMFSGRFDLSLLAAGYILSFTTPISAFHMKVEQAFERAVHFVARGIKDEKWMAHPEVQKLLVPEMQKARYRFTLWNDIWSTIQGDWLNNVEFVPTSMGTRGLQRSLFGGGLIEEYIINGALKPLQHAVAGVPVLDHVVTPILKGCEFLLSNGNTDLTNLKK